MEHRVISGLAVRVTTLAMALTAGGCTDSLSDRQVRLAMQVDRSSCNVTELNEYPLPQQLTLMVEWKQLSSELGLLSCRSLADASDKTLADLAAVAEEIGAGIEIEPALIDRALNVQVSLRLFDGLIEDCGLEPDNEPVALIFGMSMPFRLDDLLRQEEPTLAVPVRCEGGA